MRIKTCGFDIAWIGPCKNLTPCHHDSIKCVSCGEKATRECPSAGSLVCGAPLCDKCVHVKGGHAKNNKTALHA